MPYATCELSPESWPDFEKLFRAGAGWAFCSCMLFQRGRHLDRQQYPSRGEMRAKNLEDKRQLVLAERAHGILVFDASDEPVGWCQFGPAAELPLANASKLDRRVPRLEEGVEWRITCLVTAREHRRRGVARIALRAALEAIGRRGGGLVEAYPSTTPANADWAHAGTVEMFEREGFAVHERPSANYVVTRKRI